RRSRRGSSRRSAPSGAAPARPAALAGRPGRCRRGGSHPQPVNGDGVVGYGGAGGKGLVTGMTVAKGIRRGGRGGGGGGGGGRVGEAGGGRGRWRREEEKQHGAGNRLPRGIPELHGQDLNLRPQGYEPCELALLHRAISKGYRIWQPPLPQGQTRSLTVLFPRFVPAVPVEAFLCRRTDASEEEGGRLLREAITRAARPAPAGRLTAAAPSSSPRPGESVAGQRPQLLGYAGWCPLRPWSVPARPLSPVALCGRGPP